MARTWAITRRQTPWHRPESRPGKQTAPERSIVFSRTTSVDSLATARTNQEAHAVKQLHCTSRLGFNFSYSVPLKRSGAPAAWQYWPRSAAPHLWLAAWPLSSGPPFIPALILPLQATDDCLLMGCRGERARARDVRPRSAAPTAMRVARHHAQIQDWSTFVSCTLCRL